MNETTEQLLDLMIARETSGLTGEEADLLDRLMLLASGDDLERLQQELELALASVTNAELARSAAGASPEAVPERLIQQLEADADRFFGPAGVSTVSDFGQARQAKKAAANMASTPETIPKRRSGVWSGSGWAVAAMLLLALWVNRDSGVDTASPAQAREALIAMGGTVQIDWGSTDDALPETVIGDVVWNDAQQKGYLRLQGLPPNDPAATQYQLWVVDPDRSEQPVDGGVFDVPFGTRELLVPIRTTLPVDAPVAFAITREKPGGVVVSDGPLLVVASRG